MPYRSAVTGRYISRAAAARWPGRSVRESSGRGSDSGRTVSRSARTGRFVTSTTAKRNPEATLNEQV